jgi:hypothetical protein
MLAPALSHIALESFQVKTQRCKEKHAILAISKFLTYKIKEYNIVAMLCHHVLQWVIIE